MWVSLVNACTNVMVNVNMGVHIIGVEPAGGYIFPGHGNP